MHYSLPHLSQGVLGPALAIYASQPTTLSTAFSTMPLQDPTWHMDTDFVLPMENILAAKNKFANSLVGFLIGKRVAFPLVKIHKVPIVAYSEDGLSLIGYARALVEVAADKELKEEIIMVVPKLEDDGHTIKLEPANEPVDSGDGFTVVQNRIRKGKKINNGPSRQIDGLKLIKNHFTILQDDDDVTISKDKGTSSSGDNGCGDNDKLISTSLDNDNEVEDLGNEFEAGNANKGASTPSETVSNVCRYWDWTSNASLCTKGCRIVVWWNKDVVNLLVVAQSSQAIHTKITHRADNKTLFCTCIYAGNDPKERRTLWADLEYHKVVVSGSLWILLGDFNVALNMEDSFSGSSRMNSTMCDFKDCSETIDVFDVNCFGLHYTWNQKPKGNGGYRITLYRDSNGNMTAFSVKLAWEELRPCGYEVIWGDVASTRVIMDSLNEFKNVSGLVPSIPKSTAFFCNVLNHVKIGILDIMPFSEGKLSVNYLGVPSISSRLLNKDYKVLVEKARNLYWALVLAIPHGISYDIHQLIHGFLWCNGEFKKGKAKVAWNDICLPKPKGGLGLRNLEVFNLALMTTHIWNIITNKESSWGHWIHIYKLQGRTLWDIQPKCSMS
nr:hypothetical protein [Tanacetum cinerariifolium]